MTRLTIATVLGLCLAAPAQVATVPSRFALVELFTSEGCSSCPPADALLERLSTGATRSAQPIAALSFHVTYWNRLGWTDRFSDEAFTRRQGAYAKHLGLRTVYTPQMIVDGEHEFVGSDADGVDRAVRSALARSRSTQVTIQARTEGNEVTARCDVVGAPAGSVLWVAWADHDDSSSPDSGENQGRHLHHVNVVRALERAALRSGSSMSSVQLVRPANSGGSVVAWVQSGDVGPVLAGAVVAVR